MDKLAKFCSAASSMLSHLHRCESTRSRRRNAVAGLLSGGAKEVHMPGRITLLDNGPECVSVSKGVVEET